MTISLFRCGELHTISLALPSWTLILYKRCIQSIVRCRNEIVNERFKQLTIQKDIYGGDIGKYWMAFRVCAIVTQLSIENGEPLFSVDYQDPDFDNHYFQDEGHDEEDDNDPDF